jgi:hypothetical protein
MGAHDKRGSTPITTPTRHEQEETTRNVLCEDLANFQVVFEQSETTANMDHATENRGVPGWSPSPATAILYIFAGKTQMSPPAIFPDSLSGQPVNRGNLATEG